MKIFALAAFSILFILYACGRRSYRFTNIFEKGVPEGTERISIDDSYELYRRDVFTARNINAKEMSIGENTVRQSKELQSHHIDSGKLVEVEYLLLSRLHKNAIYITTIPDIGQTYYERNKLPRNIVNIQDFNTFHLGKIKEENAVEFLFPDQHGSNTWQFYQIINDSEMLSLKTIVFKIDGSIQSETRADLSMADTVEFIHVGKFILRLSKPIKKNKPREEFNSRDNIVYARKKKSNYQLLFRFSEPINRKDSTVFFKDKFVRHTPLPLLTD